jgi:hypothetical protein
MIKKRNYNGLDKILNKKTIAIVFVALMIGVSLGTIIMYAPAFFNNSGSTHNNNIITPSLSSIGETASISTSINYYTPVLQSNGATQTISLSAVENSSYSTAEYSDTSQSWTVIYPYKLTSTSFAMPSAQFWGGINGNTVQLQDLAFMSQIAGNLKYMVGDIFVNITTPASGGFNSDTFSWETTAFSSEQSSSAQVVYVNPTWNIYGAIPSYNDAYGSVTVTITLEQPTSQGWYPFGDYKYGVVTSNSQTGNVYSTQTSLPAATPVPYEIGYHFPSVTTTVGFPSTMTSSQIVTENPQYPMDAEYNGAIESVPYTFTSVYSMDTLQISVPNTPNTDSASITVQYYLGSLYEAELTSTASTASPSYTYSQVSGTTNQASAFFSFTASTPSGDVFADYGGTLTTTFTPTVTISNPYSSYIQNEVTWSGTGSSTTSGSSFNTESPSFSFNSYSETSSNTPSWTVSLNLYGNVLPSTPTFSYGFSSGSTVFVTYTTSQSDFSGELQDITIQWGDGTTTSINNQATGTYTYTHSYSGTFSGTFTKTYDIYITDINVPDPTNNGLSGLTVNSATSQYTIGLADNPTTPGKIIQIGQAIYLNVTTTNLNDLTASLTVNGALTTPTISQNGNSYTLKATSDLFGKTGVTVVWTIDFNGIIDLLSVNYPSPILPSENSTYLTALFSNTATHKYPITINSPPSGTGDYQQLVNITYPSQYGINTAYSNFQFALSNDTLLYAWTQDANSSVMQVWVKMPFDTSTIYLQVLPSFENVLSATGYTGEAPQLSPTYGEYDNGASVFVHYNNFAGTTLPSDYYVTSNGGTYSVNNGVFLEDYYLSSTFAYNSSYAIYGIMKFSAIGTVSQFNYRFGYVSDNDNFLVIGGTSSSTTSYVTNYDPSTGNSYFAPIPNFYNQTAFLGLWANDTTTFGMVNGNIYQNSNDFYNPSGSTSNIGIEALYENATVEVYALMVGNALPDGVMPTTSIGSGSAFQANATIENATYQHYANFGADQYNLSQGEYTYDIPDSFNSNYVTLYYNSSWTLDYASYEYTQGYNVIDGFVVPFITFSNVAGIGTISATFTEPIVVGEPLGTLTIGTSPTIAIDNQGFFNLPSGMIQWFANGNPVDAINGFSVVVGKPVTLTAEASGMALSVSTGGSLSSSIIYTPTQEDSYLQAYVALSEIQFINLNYSEVQVSAVNSNGVTQSQALLSPYGTGSSTADVYLPSGNYSFKYSQLNFTTGQVINTAVAPMESYNGQDWIVINGITIFQLSDQLNFTKTAVQKSIQNLQVLISLNDSEIKNLTLGVDLNLSFTNSSIHNILTNVLINETFIKNQINSTTTTLALEDNIINSTVHYIATNVTLLQNYVKTYLNATENNIYLEENFLNDTINKMNTNITTKISILNTTLNTLNLNQSTYFKIVHSIVSNINFNATERYQMEKTAGTFAYHFIPKNETKVYGGEDITAWLENTAGQPADSKNIVLSVWQNVTIDYMNLTDKYSIKPILLSYNSYSVTFYLPLNNTIMSSIINGGGTAELSIFSPFAIGGVSDIATGSINPSNSNLQHIPSLLQTLSFTSAPPSTGGLVAWIIWFFSSEFGKAVAEVIFLLSAILTMYLAMQDKKKKNVNKVLVQTYKNTKDIKDKGAS